MNENTLEAAGIPAGATQIGCLAANLDGQTEFYSVGQTLFGEVTESELEDDACSYREVRERNYDH